MKEMTLDETKTVAPILWRRPDGSLDALTPSNVVTSDPVRAYIVRCDEATARKIQILEDVVLPCEGCDKQFSFDDLIAVEDIHTKGYFCGPCAESLPIDEGWQPWRDSAQK